MYPPVIYWMSDWPLWLFLYFNTDFWVIQMQAFSIQILVGWSATLIFSAFHYWFLCQPNLCIHCLYIGWVIGHYDYSCISILSSKSAQCMHLAFKYWMDDQLLSLFLHSNELSTMIFPVFRSAKCIHSTFNHWMDHQLLWLFLRSNWLATIIIPVFQFSVPSHPNACTQHSNIGWMINYSDYSSIPILVSVSA